MADIDDMLKGSFERLAEPGNSAGVADLIRSRVAAGDTGTSADPAATVAPGWEQAARPRWFWPMLGTIGALIVILSILIGTLVVGSTPEPTASPVPSETPTESPTPTPTPTATPTPTPTPTASDEPDDDPEPPPPPPAPKDTTAPVVQQVYSNPNPPQCVTQAQVSIWALISDNTAVTRATVSWTGTTSGSGQMTAASGMWQYVFTLPSDGDWTFTVVGSDAAGNSSAPVSTQVRRVCIY